MGHVASFMSSSEGSMVNAATGFCKANLISRAGLKVIMHYGSSCRRVCFQAGDDRDILLQQWVLQRNRWWDDDSCKAWCMASSSWRRSCREVHHASLSSAFCTCALNSWYWPCHNRASTTEYLLSSCRDSWRSWSEESPGQLYRANQFKHKLLQTHEAIIF